MYLTPCDFSHIFAVSFKTHNCKRTVNASNYDRFTNRQNLIGSVLGSISLCRELDNTRPARGIVQLRLTGSFELPTPLITVSRLKRETTDTKGFNQKNTVRRPIMAKSSLVFLSKESIPLTTSEIVAQSLDKRHQDVIELIRNHINDLQLFGHVGFKEIDGQKLPQGGFAKSKEIAFLTEPQATLLISMMRNSEKVVKFKVALVKAFFQMRQALSENTQTYTPDQIAEIQDRATKKGIAIAHKSMRHPDEELCRDIAQQVFNQYVSELQENYLFIERTKADQMYDVLKWWNDHRKEFGDLRTKARETARELERLSQECDLFSEVYCFTNGKLLDYLKSEPKVED